MLQLERRILCRVECVSVSHAGAAAHNCHLLHNEEGGDVAERLQPETQVICAKVTSLAGW